MSKAEDKWYIVPELEVRVHESWVTLIQYCQQSLPFGDIKIEISNAQPGKRLKETPNIRFDKQPSAMKDGVWYTISSLDVRVHEYWINLIQWCQNYFAAGTLEFRLVNAQPTELLGVHQRVYFSKPETIPTGTPLDFIKT